MIVFHRLSGWGFACGILDSSLLLGFRCNFSSRVTLGWWVLPFGFFDPDAFLFQQLLAVPLYPILLNSEGRVLQVESDSFSVADSVNFMNSICGIMHVLFSHPSILRLENSGGACIFVLQEVFCSLLGPSCFMMFSKSLSFRDPGSLRLLWVSMSWFLWLALWPCRASSWRSQFSCSPCFKLLVSSRGV